jgi:hypothetical protein
MTIANKNNKKTLLFQKQINWIEIVILFALGSVVYLSGLLDVPFHVDETFWMASSVRWDALISGDLEHEIWTEGYDAYEVRPIPSYSVAISQRAAGIGPDQLPLSFSEAQEAYKAGADLRPTDNILYYSRLPMVISAVVSILLMSAFLSRRVSRLAGYLFFMFSLNPYFLLHLRRAMTESILILLTVLILLATYRLQQALREKHTAAVNGWTILIGILGGLAGQTKLTGLGCLVVSLLAAHVTLLLEKRQTQTMNKKYFAIITLGMPAVSLATFVAVYPFFYTNTFERVFNTLVYRVGVTRSQIEQFDWAVISDGRAAHLFERVFIDLIPTDSRPLAVALAVLVLGLTVYGIFLSIKGWSSEIKIASPTVREDTNGSDFHLILLLSTLILALPMLLTPLDWRRYFIYPVFFTLVFASLGLEKITSAAQPSG